MTATPQTEGVYDWLKKRPDMMIYKRLHLEFAGHDPTPVGSWVGVGWGRSVLAPCIENIRDCYQDCYDVFLIPQTAEATVLLQLLFPR